MSEIMSCPDDEITNYARQIKPKVGIVDHETPDLDRSNGTTSESSANSSRSRGENNRSNQGSWQRKKAAAAAFLRKCATTKEVHPLSGKGLPSLQYNDDFPAVIAMDPEHADASFLPESGTSVSSSAPDTQIEQAPIHNACRKTEVNMETAEVSRQDTFWVQSVTRDCKHTNGCPEEDQLRRDVKKGVVNAVRRLSCQSGQNSVDAPSDEPRRTSLVTSSQMQVSQNKALHCIGGPPRIFPRARQDHMSTAVLPGTPRQSTHNILEHGQQLTPQKSNQCNTKHTTVAAVKNIHENAGANGCDTPKTPTVIIIPDRSANRQSRRRSTREVENREAQNESTPSRNSQSRRPVTPGSAPFDESGNMDTPSAPILSPLHYYYRTRHAHETLASVATSCGVPDWTILALEPDNVRRHGPHLHASTALELHALVAIPWAAVAAPKNSHAESNMMGLDHMDETQMLQGHHRSLTRTHSSHSRGSCHSRSSRRSSSSRRSRSSHRSHSHCRSQSELPSSLRKVRSDSTRSNHRSHSHRRSKSHSELPSNLRKVRSDSLSRYQSSHTEDQSSALSSRIPSKDESSGFTDTNLRRRRRRHRHRGHASSSSSIEDDKYRNSKLNARCETFAMATTNICYAVAMLCGAEDEDDRSILDD